jgi:hypothetical protein
MKLHTLLTMTTFTLSAIILNACNMPSTGVTTPDPGLVYTQAAQTAAVLPTIPPPTALPPVVITPVTTTPTMIIVPTNTPLPTATATVEASPTSASCTNQAEFVDDVTVPDDTEILTGQEFIKTWRLKNTGTCTWTDKYALVFVEGDQMNGTSPLPLTGSTAPDSTVDLSAPLKAPGTTGTYRGDWQLQDASNNIFGLGKNADQTFYIQIKVVEGVSNLNLGTPTWRDTMDNAKNWYLLNTANTKWTEGDGVIEMKSIQPGGDEWGLANKPAMQDYYLQATFIMGDTCSALDRYGLLGRSPDPNKGYVLEFSCDGRYRLYTWDGENYHALQEWRTASSIKVGANQTNVMGLWMKGNELQVYANGYKLGEFTDSMFDEGQFGLAIASVNTDNLTVKVDLVEYWELNQ